MEVGPGFLLQDTVRAQVVAVSRTTRRLQFARTVSRQLSMRRVVLSSTSSSPPASFVQPRARTPLRS